jgi:predicted amidohydrolase
VSVRIAVVQPVLHAPPHDEANVEAAVRQIHAAAAQGADIVAFPETYPGPWRMPSSYDPAAVIEAAAREAAVYVQYGSLEPIAGAPRSAYNVLRLAYPDISTPAGTYRRTHPPGPWIYTDGPQWDFDYVAGDDLPVFATAHAAVGMAMCSEVYMPEITRALALRGAEILFMPGGLSKKALWETWRNLLWSRAIENLAVVVTTQSVLRSDERGLAMIATPEKVVFESVIPGMFVVDIDLDRIRELRRREDRRGSNELAGVKTGLLTQWQRPEMRQELFR